MGEIAGEGGFAPMGPTPPGTHLDNGDFIPHQGPGNFTDIGGFTPSQVGFTTEHGDYLPYEPTYGDEHGNRYLVPPGPYNSPIYGEGYIDDNHVFHPKFGPGENPDPVQYGPAPAILNFPHNSHDIDPDDPLLHPHYTFRPISLSGVPGLLKLNRNYSDGSLRPSIPSQSEKSLWFERGVLERIVNVATAEEIVVIERFKSEIYPDDLHEFYKFIKIKMAGTGGNKPGEKELDSFLTYIAEKLREKRVSDIVKNFVFGLYSSDMSDLYPEAEVSVKMKLPPVELGEFLIPKIEKILFKTNGYAGYYFDEFFLERNKLVRSLTKRHGAFVDSNLESEFHDAIIDGLSSGLKGHELDSYVQRKANEFAGFTDNDVYEASIY